MKLGSNGQILETEILSEGEASFGTNPFRWILLLEREIFEPEPETSSRNEKGIVDSYLECLKRPHCTVRCWSHQARNSKTLADLAAAEMDTSQADGDTWSPL